MERSSVTHINAECRLSCYDLWLSIALPRSQLPAGADRSRAISRDRPTKLVATVSAHYIASYVLPPLLAFGRRPRRLAGPTFNRLLGTRLNDGRPNGRPPPSGVIVVWQAALTSGTGVEPVTTSLAVWCLPPEHPTLSISPSADSMFGTHAADSILRAKCAAGPARSCFVFS